MSKINESCDKYNAEAIARALREQGFVISEVVAAAGNANAGIFLKDSNVSISVGFNDAWVTTKANGAFHFGESRDPTDIAAIIDDVRRATS